ncbi:MAG TPA: hypothetical protein VGE77_10155 [Nocardioides sp.]
MDRGTHTTATALIDAVRERTRTARVAEAAAFVAVGDWADAHTSDAVVGDPIGALGEWLDPEHAETLAGDQFLELGGPGAPVVAEFCIGEIAAIRGCSFDAARRLVGDVVELRHRLPRIHARVAAGEVEVWRGRRIAQQTRVLSFEGARFVDAHIAYVAGRATTGDVDRLVAEAAARFDPESLEAEQLEADAGRHVTIDFSGLAYRDPLTGTLRGIVDITGSLDLADALDLERAVAHVAGQLADLGSADDLDVRRSIALGEIARRSDGIEVLDYDASGSADRPVTRSKREVVIYVHLDQAAIAGTVNGFGPGIDACTGTTGIDLARLDTPGHAPRPGHGRSGPRVVRRPGHPGGHQAGHRPHLRDRRRRRGRGCPRAGGRRLPPDGADRGPRPAPLAPLRVPLLHPQRPRLRPRPPQRLRPHGTPRDGPDLDH